MTASDFQKKFADLGPLETAPGSVFGFRMWWGRRGPAPVASAYVSRAGLVLSDVMNFMAMLSPPAIWGLNRGAWNEPVMQAKCLVGEGVTSSYVSCDCVMCRPGWLRRCLDAPGEDCVCGFYAYWEAHALPDSEHLGGVIEGYGKTLIGTAGFRCEKARVVGLYNPHGIYLPESYAQVPVFSAKKELLERFPLTTDYLPKPAENPPTISDQKV